MGVARHHSQTFPRDFRRTNFDLHAQVDLFFCTLFFWIYHHHTKSVLLMEESFRAHQDRTQGQLLFFVSRSLNRNVVVYSLHDGNVQAQWLMYEKASPEGHVPTEELNLIERNSAYGFEIQGQQMTLKALSDRSMIIGLDESSQAAAFFGDRKVLSVHVVMASGIIPRVDHVVVSFGDGTTEIIKK